MNINQIKVKNMISGNGNPIANQFIIRVKSNSESQVAFDTVYFQSYDSMIACKDFQNKVTLDKDYWDYSRTTLKYLSQFLNVSGKKEIEENIKNDTYSLSVLN